MRAGRMGCMARKPDLPCAVCGKLLWRSRTSLPAGQATCRECRALRQEQAQKQCCEACGTYFVASYAANRFCSMMCANARHKGGVGTVRSDRSCEVCGAAYYATYAEQRTCGRLCGVALRKTVTGTMRIPEPEAPSSRVYFVECAYCGLLFASRRPRLKCGSDECYQLHRHAYYETYYVTHKDVFIANAHLRRARIAQVERYEDIDLTYVGNRDKWKCALCGRKVRQDLPVGHPMRPSIDHIVSITNGGDHTYANVQLAHRRCNSRKGNRDGSMGNGQLALY